jgi:hypothetical protein
MEALRHLFVPPVDEEADTRLRQREDAAEEAARSCLGKMRQARLQYDTRASVRAPTTTAEIDARINADDAAMREALSSGHE